MIALEEIEKQAQTALAQLFAAAKPQKGDLLVVGCSSSEVTGGTIGQQSSFETAQAIVRGFAPVLKQYGVHLAAQCCEHLNRALIVERADADKDRLVCVVPKPKAGGSFATAVYESMTDPVAVEWVKADLGMDIGDTLIGMHLRPVAVPVRIEQSQIGCARVVCARTRPKLIGGERACYQ